VSIEPWWGRIGPLTYALGSLLLARTLASSFLPDIIHAHTSLLDGTAARVLSWWFGKPYIITEHTGPFSVLTQNPASRRYVRRAVRGAKYFVSVSSHLQNEVLTQLGLSEEVHRNFVIPNGFDPKVFFPTAMPPAESVKVLWVGAFVEIKQPLLAIEAFAQAAAKNEALSLTMVGAGALEPAMKTKIAELGLSGKVTVRPTLPRSVLAEVMRSHHYLMVTSKSETFCLVALEALACGRPVLTTACGGPVDFVGGTGRGMIVSSNCDELERGMLAMAANLKSYDYASIGSFVLERFSYESVAERISGLYEQAVVS
jgi:glycosyltransferase involved in cell wall biosynthesis